MRHFSRKLFAILKRDSKIHLSYKVSVIFEIFAALANILIFFFIGHLIDRSAQPFLAPYGEKYFPFALIGISFAGLQGAALHSFSTALAREHETGTLEAVLMTPTSINMLLLAGTIWQMIWTSLRILLFMMCGIVIFKVSFVQMNWFSLLLMSLLTITALSGFGLLSAAFLLVFRRGDPIQFLLSGLSKFLGGVYFPIAVLPFWLKGLALLLPLTYALEGIRKAMLLGLAPNQLRHEMGILSLFSIIFLPLGFMALNTALAYAKKRGTLSLQ